MFSPSNILTIDTVDPVTLVAGSVNVACDTVAEIRPLSTSEAAKMTTALCALTYVPRDGGSGQPVTIYSSTDAATLSTSLETVFEAVITEVNGLELNASETRYYGAALINAPSLVTANSTGSAWEMNYQRPYTYTSSDSVSTIKTRIAAAKAAADLPSDVMRTGQDNLMSGTNAIQFGAITEYIEGTVAGIIDFAAASEIAIRLAGTKEMAFVAAGPGALPQFQFPMGHATNPGLAFYGDNTTGIFQNGAVAGTLSIRCPNGFEIQSETGQINASATYLGVFDVIGGVTVIEVDAAALTAKILDVYADKQLNFGTFTKFTLCARYAFAGGATGAVGVHNLTVDATLPDNAVCQKTWYEVTSTFTSPTGPDNATVALGIATDDATGIKAAVAINDASNPWDAGFHDGDQDGTAANFTTKTTAARNLILTVGVEAITAGAVNVYADYFVGA